jgi:hypothetical protein
MLMIALTSCGTHEPAAQLKMKMARTNVEWNTQVSKSGGCGFDRAKFPRITIVLRFGSLAVQEAIEQDG